MDRPEEFRFALAYGKVTAIHEVTWEVDLLPESGGAVFRALVLGPFMPAVSTDERPQWCLFGYAAARQSMPFAFPIESRLPGSRLVRTPYRYYEEVLDWRITINTANDVEILHPTKHYHILLQEKDGVIRVETPKTRLVLKDSDGSALLECTDKLTVHCKDADVHVEHDAVVKVDHDVDLTVGKDVTAKVAGSVEAQVGANLDVEVGGGANITVEGKTTVKASGAAVLAVDCQNIQLGRTGAKKPVMLDSVIAKFNAHTHGGVDTGSGTTSPPNSNTLSPADATVDVVES